jgi:hypothetical protein
VKEYANRSPVIVVIVISLALHGGLSSPQCVGKAAGETSV